MRLPTHAHLLLEARPHVLRRAFVEAGVVDRLDLLALDHAADDERRPVSHLERALADLGVAAALLLLGVDAFWRGTFVGSFIVLAVMFDRLMGARLEE
jgi:hypothetical protein